MSELLTVEEAARACGVSKDTIKRRLRDGQFPGARRGVARGQRQAPWVIPRADLAAAGLHLPGGDGDDAGSGDVEVLRSRLARAEALAAARELHISDLRAELCRLHDHVERLAEVAASGACEGRVPTAPAAHRRTAPGSPLQEGDQGAQEARGEG